MLLTLFEENHSDTDRYTEIDRHTHIIFYRQTDRQTLCYLSYLKRTIPPPLVFKIFTEARDRQKDIRPTDRHYITYPIKREPFRHRQIHRDIDRHTHTIFYRQTDG